MSLRLFPLVATLLIRVVLAQQRILYLRILLQLKLRITHLKSKLRCICSYGILKQLGLVRGMAKIKENMVRQRLKET